MNPLRNLCVLACFVAVALATNSYRQSNSLNNYDDPSNWVSISEIEQLPTLKDVTLRRLEGLTVDEGASLLDKMCK